jgi:hypothetical protein
MITLTRTACPFSGQQASSAFGCAPWALYRAYTISRLAGGWPITPALAFLLRNPAFRQPGFIKYSGPSGIRTRGLLNAIETRSQLRYGPIHNFGFCLRVMSQNQSISNPQPSISGPGGIRTRGLLSAIEARSQLRYRPWFQGRRNCN